MIVKAPNISPGSKICDSCRKKLSKLTSVPTTPVISPESESESYLDEQEITTSLNVCLSQIGETPYTKTKSSRRKSYSHRKIEKLTEALSYTGLSEAHTDQDGKEKIQQLKENFETLTNASEKLQLLTVLPKSWSVKKIEEEFHVSSYLARKSKRLTQEKGILSLPNARLGHPLSKQTVEIVTQFYLADDNSRAMPGKKDYVSVRQEGKRVQLQKRLVLNNLRELYQQFKEGHPTLKIGFSKFAEFRPKQCILAGSNGTHCVCVCTIHQNVKLMVQQLNISELSTYHHCLSRIMCNPPSPSCYLGDCSTCPDVQSFKEEFIELMEKYEIDKVVFKQWVSTDRSKLETHCLPSEEFADLFCEQLEILRPHLFLA